MNKGNFFDWGGTYYLNEGHSMNKGNFFDWGGTDYLNVGHSMNKGNILTEKGPNIYIRVIQ